MLTGSEKISNGGLLLRKERSMRWTGLSCSPAPKDKGHSSEDTKKPEPELEKTKSRSPHRVVAMGQ